MRAFFAKNAETYAVSVRLEVEVRRLVERPQNLYETFEDEQGLGGYLIEGVSDGRDDDGQEDGRVRVEDGRWVLAAQQVLHERQRVDLHV